MNDFIEKDEGIRTLKNICILSIKFVTTNFSNRILYVFMLIPIKDYETTLENIFPSFNSIYME